MAHEIAKIDGQDAMWCVGGREAAWHSLGQRTETAQTWEQAIVLAGLDWEVEKIHLIAPKYTTTKKDANDELIVVPSREIESWGVFRKTDGFFFGNVGRVYHCIQNRHAGQFLDALLEQEGGANYESAGALKDGRIIWALANIPGISEIRILGTDDVTKMHLLYTTSHDGSSASICKLTATRVVCMNTLREALQGEGAVLAVRHTKSAEERMEAAKAAMTGIVQSVSGLEKKLNILALRLMTRETMLDILTQLWPTPAEDMSQSAHTWHENILTKVLELFESNDNNAIPEIRGTAYNALNAVTEYVDHDRTGIRTDGKDAKLVRAESALFGSGNDIKEKAFKILLNVTEGARERGAKVSVSVPGTPLQDLPKAKNVSQDVLAFIEKLAPSETMFVDILDDTIEQA